MKTPIQPHQALGVVLNRLLVCCIHPLQKVLIQRPAQCHWTLFLLVFFCPFSTQLHSTFLTHISPHAYLWFMPLTLTNRRQEHITIGTTSHQTTCLLGYRHPETVLLWFLFNPILCLNLLCHHRTLPPLKVPDFLDMEHE